MDGRLSDNQANRILELPVDETVANDFAVRSGSFSGTRLTQGIAGLTSLTGLVRIQRESERVQSNTQTVCSCVRLHAHARSRALFHPPCAVFHPPSLSHTLHRCIFDNVHLHTSVICLLNRVASGLQPTAYRPFRCRTLDSATHAAPCLQQDTVAASGAGGTEVFLMCCACTCSNVCARACTRENIRVPTNCGAQPMWPFALAWC